jgi:pullulanase/glycogen debranching enzyme
LFGIKHSHPDIWQDSYLHYTGEAGVSTILWYNMAGELMQPVHWGQHHCKSVGYMVEKNKEEGQRLNYLTLFNAGNSPLVFKLPDLPGVRDWQVLLDTSQHDGKPVSGNGRVIAEYALAAYSTCILHASTVESRNNTQESLL